MKVLLADDHALFKEGLRNLLAARGVEVVGMARDGLEALEQARALRPDVVLMDIQMPRYNGLTATRLIKTELPHIKIVMLTTSASDDDLFEAIKSGAEGYLLKSLDAEHFFELLFGVAQGVFFQNATAGACPRDLAREHACFREYALRGGHDALFFLAVGGRRRLSGDDSGRSNGRSCSDLRFV